MRTVVEQPDLVNYWNHVCGFELVRWIPKVAGEPWMVIEGSDTDPEYKQNEGDVWVLKGGKPVAIAESVSDVPVICMDNGMMDIGLKFQAVLDE